MDIYVELQDSDAEFLLFVGGTYTLTCGGLNVYMNQDQFQRLCDELRPWIVEDRAQQANKEQPPNDQVQP